MTTSKEWKMTSKNKMKKMEEDLTKMEDDLNKKIKNGRRPQTKNENGRQLQFFFE
jgi:hypothetical protein